ncbi:hypothetical protein CAEBREN_10504 [Caenorhabditis brenneri]|uniref:Uncharacterized protein n=1 Tax=Caenorhabditis brenneri TaxID=135651 RepID=G0P0M3_CAEBE|nr:hypothetical protein CAEBREN_10504 [Caenorhabditis brenneri]
MNTSDRLNAASVFSKTFGELDRVVPHRIKLLNFEPNAITVNTKKVYLVHQFVYVQRRFVFYFTKGVNQQRQPKQGIPTSPGCHPGGSLPEMDGKFNVINSNGISDNVMIEETDTSKLLHKLQDTSKLLFKLQDTKQLLHKSPDTSKLLLKLQDTSKLLLQPPHISKLLLKSPHTDKPSGSKLLNNNSWQDNRWLRSRQETRMWIADGIQMIEELKARTTTVLKAIADQNRQREEHMRREQSRQRSAPRDPRAGHPRDARGQEQALPQAPRYHQTPSSVPHHFQARVTPQPMREDQEHRQQLARDEDENSRRRRHQVHHQQELRNPRHGNPAHGKKQQVHHPPHTHQNAEQGQLHLAAQLQGEDGMRRHQDRPVQIKQEPHNDALTIIAEFRGDGVAAARMESSRAQEFRKEQYMRREAVRREKEMMMTEIEEKKCAADIELAKMELEAKEREIAHKRAMHFAEAPALRCFFTNTIIIYLFLDGS